MIPVETWYKTHNQELLAIVKAFKTWLQYLESGKFELLVIINHNNLYQFIYTKSLSSRQVRWAKEISWYYFQINDQQGKTNVSTDVLSRFL